MTVNTQSSQVTHVLARFDSYRGKYVLNCHELEYEGMMTMTGEAGLRPGA